MATSHFGKESCSKQRSAHLKGGARSACRACELQVINTCVLSCATLLPGVRRFRDEHVLGHEGHAAADSETQSQRLKKSRTVASSSTTTRAEPGPESVAAAPAAQANLVGNVHHLWLDLHAEPVGPERPFLNDIALECIRSWAPMVQCLWLYDTGHGKTLAENVQGLRIKNAADILAPGIVLSLLAGQVAMQLIKDIFSMKVLALHGGIWADLDVMWLGRIPPIQSGHAFALEPHSRCSGEFLGRKSDRVTLAWFAMPKGSPLAVTLADHWLKYWLRWAADHFLQTEPFEWDKKNQQSLWMKNTTEFTKKVLALPAARTDYLHMPLVFMPFPIRMSTAQLALARHADLTPGLADIKALDYDKPYMVPALKDIALHSCTANIWQRQWPKDLQDDVLAALAEIRSANLRAGPAVALIAKRKLQDVANAIEEFSPVVLAHMGLVHGHAMLSMAHHVLHQPWCLRLLRPGAADLWHGPEPEVSVWASVLLLWALKNPFAHSPDLEGLSNAALMESFLLQPREAQVSVADLSDWFSNVSHKNNM